MKNSAKKYKLFYWLMLFIPLLLMACSPEKSLSKEEIANQVSANKEEVQSYHAKINLDTSVKDLLSDEIVNESKTFTNITINEKTLDSYGKIKSENNQQKLYQEYYSIGDRAYLRMKDDGDWKDVSSQQAEYFHNTDTFYTTLVPVVEILSKMGDLKEESDQYILTFSGESVDVYQAFETPFNLQFSNVEPKDIHQEIEVVVEKDTLFIKSVENTLSSEVSNHDLQIYIKQAYDHINDIEEFKIPQEVIDKAK